MRQVASVRDLLRRPELGHDAAVQRVLSRACTGLAKLLAEKSEGEEPTTAH